MLITRTLRTVALIVSVAGSQANAGGLLNGGFDTPTPGLSAPNYEASVTAANAKTPSSAEHWVLENSLAGRATTSSALLASTDPDGGGYMLHFSTTGSPGEIGQIFDLGSGPQKATASIDVLVLSGVAKISFNNDVVTVHPSQNWQTINLGLTEAGPFSDFIIGTNATGVNCYLDNASVTAAGTVPEPSSLCLGMLGLLGMFGATRWGGIRGDQDAETGRN